VPIPKKLTSPSGKPLLRVGLMLAIAMGLVVGFFYVAIQSTVKGTEFCPQTFQTRDFSYNRFPGTKLRLTSTRLSTPSAVIGTPVLQHLKTMGNTRWDVIDVSEGTMRDQRSPTILIKMVQITGPDGVKFWENWSTKNPSLAAAFWPIVQTAAVQATYFCIPDLMRKASDATDVNDLINSCEQILSEAKSILESNS